MSDIDPSQTFVLPNTEKYDETLALIDGRIEETGGLWSYIDHVRTKRKSSDNYATFLVLSREHAFNWQKRPDDVRLLDQTEMRRARTMVTGMVMGQVVNEELFPRLISKFVYPTVTVPEALYERAGLDVQALSQLNAVEVQRIAYDLATKHALSKIGKAGREIADKWAHWHGIQDPDLFTTGLGTSIYLAGRYQAARYSKLIKARKEQSELDSGQVEPLA